MSRLYFLWYAIPYETLLTIRILANLHCSIIKYELPSKSGADLGEGCRGCASPSLWDDLRLSNTTDILQIKKWMNENYVVHPLLKNILDSFLQVMFPSWNFKIESSLPRSFHCLMYTSFTCLHEFPFPPHTPHRSILSFDPKTWLHPAAWIGSSHFTSCNKYLYNCIDSKRLPKFKQTFWQADLQEKYLCRLYWFYFIARNKTNAVFLAFSTEWSLAVLDLK